MLRYSALYCGYASETEVSVDFLARAAALTQGEASLSRAQRSSVAAYKGGMVSLIEVLDADRRLLETRDGAIEARAAASRGAVASFRALGGGWAPATPTGTMPPVG